MEATMLKTSSEFPHPGSYALLDGVKVRIIRADRGGDVFVTGEGVARVIGSSHLVAFNHDSPIGDQWLDHGVSDAWARVAPHSPAASARFSAWVASVFLPVPRLSRMALRRNFLTHGRS